MTILLNTPETSFQLDLNAVVVSRDPSELSPIDLFYEQRLTAVKLGAAGDLAANDELRGIGLIPVFSAAEMYFRRLLARAVRICPICAEQAATQQISLGSIEALDKQEIAFAIGEHQGFTSEGEIGRRTQKVLDIDLNRSASVKAAVHEFEQLCHLRHSIVHSAGELMYLNRRQLGLRKSGRVILAIPASEFQAVVTKVSNVVRAYNSYVGREIVLRWFKVSMIGSTWRADKSRFCRLIDVFWSAEDMGSPADYRKLYGEFRTAAGLS